MKYTAKQKLSIREYKEIQKKLNDKHNSKCHQDDIIPFYEWLLEMNFYGKKEYGIEYNREKECFEYNSLNINYIY